MEAAGKRVGTIKSEPGAFKNEIKEEPKNVRRESHHTADVEVKKESPSSSPAEKRQKGETGKFTGLSTL